jgi:AraC-like DNA-binding protein
MFVHASRIEKQFQYLTNLGISITPLLRQTGISGDIPFEPQARFDFEQYKQILEFALRQTGDPEYGLAFGNQSQLGGTIGMMSASCKNFKEALVKGCEFLKLQGDFAELKFMDDDAYPKLVYTPLESWTLESPQTAKLEVDAMFSFLNTILKINSNDTLRPRQLNLAFPTPQNPDRYYEVFGVNPRFDAAVNEMVFDNATLMIPMKAYNPETYQVLNHYLQNQLVKLAEVESLSDKVKNILHSSFKYQFPDIESVAEKLSLSARTLQRKLSEEQTTFKDIMQETRFGIARQLLKQKHLTVSEISYMLGYSDLGNFSRSFKKYSGLSPQAFRDINNTEQSSRS